MSFNPRTHLFIRHCLFSNADSSSSLVSPSPQPFTHRHLSHSQQPLSLSGNFGQNLFRKKSPGGYFNKADQPFLEMFTNTSSGGDSDSSQDSLQMSSRTVNFPLTKKATSQNRSLDISQGRLARSNSLLQTVFSIGKRKKMATIRVSQKELIDRLIKLICVAVDTCIFSGIGSVISFCIDTFPNKKILDNLKIDKI